MNNARKTELGFAIVDEHGQSYRFVQYPNGMRLLGGYPRIRDTMIWGEEATPVRELAQAALENCRVVPVVLTMQFLDPDALGRSPCRLPSQGPRMSDTPTAVEAWSWSFNGEYFEGSGDSRESVIHDAINAGSDLLPGMTLHVGINVPHKPSIDASLVLERLGEEAYNEVGEVCSGWPAATPAQEDALTERLDAVLDAWMTEHGLHPHFWAVPNQEEVVLTAELLAEHGYSACSRTADTVQ